MQCQPLQQTLLVVSVFARRLQKLLTSLLLQQVYTCQANCAEFFFLGGAVNFWRFSHILVSIAKRDGDKTAGAGIDLHVQELQREEGLTEVDQGPGSIRAKLKQVRVTQRKIQRPEQLIHTHSHEVGSGQVTKLLPHKLVCEQARHLLTPVDLYHLRQQEQAAD